MKLRDKVLELLDVYYSDNESNAVIQRDLMRRGKIDNRKIIEILFLIIDEIDASKVTKDKK